MESFRIDKGLGQSLEFKELHPEPGSGVGDAFGKMVEKLLNQTNDAQVDADRKAEQFAKGDIGVVETVLSINKADTSLRLLLEVRNKALEAYREIIRAT